MTALRMALEQRHYQRTALDWLANFDAHHDEIEAILRTPIYGRGAVAGSSSPPPACSVTPAKEGLVIIG
jgi:hypothetical protein